MSVGFMSLDHVYINRHCPDRGAAAREEAEIEAALVALQRFISHGEAHPGMVHINRREAWTAACHTQFLTRVTSDGRPETDSIDVHFTSRSLIQRDQTLLLRHKLYLTGTCDGELHPMKDAPPDVIEHIIGNSLTRWKLFVQYGFGLDEWLTMAWWAGVARPAVHYRWYFEPETQAVISQGAFPEEIHRYWRKSWRFAWIAAVVCVRVPSSKYSN